MSSDVLAVQAADLSKRYTIYKQPIDRLKQSVVPRLIQAFGGPPRTYYREFWALRSVSLDVGKGETIGIIGRNGSGKSTLLQLICGTLTPTLGSVETKGRITALLELGSGFNPEFSGRENVFLNGAILGLSREEIEARFDAIAEFADIGDFIDQPVKFYSSGMTVRLAFSVQAMVDPDILIVDEALAVGDERFQRKCFRRLDDLKSQGTTILFVSHTGQQIIEHCDRAMLLEQGRRLLFSDPITVVRAYQKLIYAKPPDHARLIQEFKEMDQAGVTTSKLPADVPSKEQSIPQPESNVPPAKQSDASVHPDGDTKIPEKDFYEDGMIPQTTQAYPVQGARVDSIKIFNSEGKVVNNLLFGREYDFEVRGTFLEDREAVRIGVHIRTKTDLEVTGQSYPGKGKYFHGVKRGQKFKLVHKLKMVLTPNTYFVGSGIWSTTEPLCLHRIIDATMFRVLPGASSHSFGFVDLSVGGSEFAILE